jgi:CRP/FNR family transcriptional regulator, cyclic AMP receptor protein
LQMLNPRTGQSASETSYASDARSPAGRSALRSRQQIFQLKRGGSGNRADSPGGEGYRKLAQRLTSRGVPQSIVEELFEQRTVVSYSRGAFIFLEGAPIDLFFWVSSGLVDILAPGPDGKQIITNVLGPGDFFGFIESPDHKGRPTQAFQARARTNVQIGLHVRENICKVLRRQDPALLVDLTQQMIAAWSEFTLRQTRFLGQNHRGRLEMVLAELATKFGVKESRGTLLIPEFGHEDFAEMIGSSRPMVSRLLAEMIAAGTLAQHGRQYIIVDSPGCLQSHPTMPLPSAKQESAFRDARSAETGVLARRL